MKKLSILFLLTSLSLFSITNEARFDMLTIKLKRQLQKNDYQRAIITFDKIKKFNQKLPIFYEFYEGKANFQAKNYDKAYQLLDNYITKVKRKGKYYKDALPMLVSIEELKEKQNIQLKQENEIQKRDVYFDNNTGLMWQNSRNLNYSNFKIANEYCKNLNLAGYNDWYLPNLSELKTLINKKNKPKIIKFLKDISKNKNSIFWATDKNVDNGVWSLDFNLLYSQHHNINTKIKYYVRCIRN